MRTTTPLTVPEYREIYAEDDRWMELVGGEVVFFDLPLTHARIHGNILSKLVMWQRAGSHRVAVLGLTALHLTDHDLYVPDASVTVADPRLTERELLADLPLLCIEVRSRGKWCHDVGRKKTIFEHGGLPELWLVDDRSNSVLVYRRSKPGHPTFDVELEVTDTLTSPQLPGLALPLSELFADVP